MKTLFICRGSNSIMKKFVERLRENILKIRSRIYMRGPKRLIRDVLITRHSYEAVAEGYASWRSRPWSISRLSSPGNILDLGSGHCINGVEAALKTNSYVVCVDYSVNMITIAKMIIFKKDVYGDYVVADMLRTPFRENSFNTILLIASIHHIPEYFIRRITSDLNRILRRRGLIIITIWSWRQSRFVFDLFFNMIKTFLGLLDFPRRFVVKWRSRRGVFERVYYLYSLEEISREIERKNLRILSRGYYSPMKRSSENIYIIALKD